MAHHAPFQNDDDRFAPYEVIGELGSRPLPLYVARQTALGAGSGQLVVAERFAGAGKTGNAAGSDMRREARRLTTLASPHLARVREVAVREDDLVVFGDFIDGEKLAEFWPPAGTSSSPFARLPLEVALRILLDALTGAAALHGLRDASQQPMKLTHGEISPATLLFGSDGVARILHAVARRAADAQADPASLGYLAPEVHAGDAQDARTDVFSVGVLLWEALEGKLLSPQGTEAAGVRVRSGAVAASSVPEKAPWAKALGAVAVRALAAAPEDRWPTAAAMAAEIRKASGLKLAAASAAAAYAKATFGDHAKERRARWESVSRSMRPAPAASGPSVVPVSGTPRPESEVRPRLDTPPTIRVATPPTMRVVTPPTMRVATLAAAVAPPARFAAPAAAPPPGFASPVLVPPTAAQARPDVLSVPNSMRSEEVSSSILESFRPPPPPVAASASSVARDPPRNLEPLAFDPLEAPVSESVASADAPLPFEAPVVFEDAPHAVEGGDAAPVLPVFGPAFDESDEGLRRPSRRRLFVFGGAGAALCAAAIAVVAIRGTHQPTPTDATPAATQAAPPVPPIVAAAPVAAPPAPSASVAAAASVPSSAPPAKSVTTAKPKTGPKHAGGAAHTKASTVRAAGHSKPGSN